MTARPTVPHRGETRQRVSPASKAWIAELEHGDDAGLFGPGSAVWAVNGALPTAIAGIRALMMQSLHPAVMAGMYEHSHYHHDPIARLNRTIRWVATTTFGDSHAAEVAAHSLHRIHDRVNGTYIAATGADRSYSAHDPDLLRWVHVTFTEALLGAHLIWGNPIPGGPDAFVNEWGRVGTLMGVADPPTNAAELQKQLAGFEAYSSTTIGSPKQCTSSGTRRCHNPSEPYTQFFTPARSRPCRLYTATFCGFVTPGGQQSIPIGYCSARHAY